MFRSSWRCLAPVAAVVVAACGDQTGPSDVLLPQGQIVVGFNHTCYLNVDGRVHCWGWGGLGQLGNGDTVSVRDPRLVMTDQRFIQLAAGSNHTCALNAEGAAYCWGAQVYGELGTGTMMGFADQPLPVSGGIRFQQLAVGDGHTCGVAAGGEIFCWGLNIAGQLGMGATGDLALPTRVASALRFTQVGAGLNVTCGITTDSHAYCWGDNTWGQLGTGTIGGSSADPVAVGGSGLYRSVSVGSFVVCAVTLERDAHCWGLGTFGRLGNGEALEQPVADPTLVVGGIKYGSLVVGAQHSCAVAIDQQGFCWGLNTYGKLGDDVGPAGLQPSVVSGGHLFTEAGAGSNHSCGVTPQGEVYCWGQNFLGQLGVPGQTKPTFTPRRVIF